MAESATGDGRLTPERVMALALAAGVDLGAARAAALVPQAEPHFELLRAIDEAEDRGAEPAGELRLDGWRRGHDG